MRGQCTDAAALGISGPAPPRTRRQRIQAVQRRRHRAHQAYPPVPGPRPHHGADPRGSRRSGHGNALADVRATGAHQRAHHTTAVDIAGHRRTQRIRAQYERG